MAAGVSVVHAHTEEGLACIGHGEVVAGCGESVPFHAWKLQGARLRARGTRVTLVAHPAPPAPRTARAGLRPQLAGRSHRLQCRWLLIPVKPPTVAVVFA